MSKRDSRLAQVIGRHLHVYFIAHADPDEILAHLAGNVREHFMAVRQGDAKHGPG